MSEVKSQKLKIDGINMLNLSHKNLDVWNLAVEFVVMIYKITLKYLKEELFGLTAHTRKSSVSVPSNIAEGCSRKSLIERIRFFEISRSSLVEIETQIEIANKLGFISNIDYEEINKELNILFAKLSNFMKNAK